MIVAGSTLGRITVYDVMEPGCAIRKAPKYMTERDWEFKLTVHMERSLRATWMIL